MPRDSGGNYTLPAGNPVTAGTIIEDTWANDTMSDIATQLNNVFTRDGLLGPSDQFPIIAGTAAAPGLAFAADLDVGLFRPATNALAVSTAGVERLRIAADGQVNVVEKLVAEGDLEVQGDIVLTNGYKAVDGSAAAPSFSFASDTNTGIYRVGADSLGISTNGVVRATVSNTGLSVSGDLSVSGTFAPGTFSPTNLVTSIATGNLLTLGTTSYLSNENVDPADITIAAGSCNNTSNTGGSVNISAGYGGLGGGSINVYTADNALANGNSGSLSIYTGDSEDLTGSISIATGDGNDEASGDITLQVGSVSAAGARSGDIVIKTKADGSTYPEQTGKIELTNGVYATIKIQNNGVSLAKTGATLSVSGAGTGATVTGSRSRMGVICGTTPTATITVTDSIDLVGAGKSFYYYNANVAAPRPIYGGTTGASSTFVLVFPVAPSASDVLQVFCLDAAG